MYNNSTISEEEDTNKILAEYENLIRTEVTEYNDDTLPVSPKLTKGMTRVRWNSTSGKWEKISGDNTRWYDYGNKEWANVVLVGENGKDATGQVDVFNSDGTLNENSAYTQLVWIPRYAYKITSQYHTEGTGAGNIEIVFINTENKGKDGTEYSTTYPATAAGAMSDYVVHPAFDYGGNHLSGFWVGKFESSNTNCTLDSATGNVEYTGNEIMTVKANVTSWRYISTGNAFATCLNMNKSGNPYGLSTSDSVVDPHLVKNTEWGAVAYLSQSTYGKNSEVWNNSNTDYITGMAGSSVNAGNESDTNEYNTGLGVNASTTGNVTGVYDMSGGNWERTAAYVNNGSNSLILYGGELTIEGTASKYRNVYESTVSDGTDAQIADYDLTRPSKGHYGDAIWETSSQTGESNPAYSWYSDHSAFPQGGSPFFIYGGYHNDSSVAGVFSFIYSAGVPFSYDGFRVSLAVF